MTIETAGVKTNVLEYIFFPLQIEERVYVTGSCTMEDAKLHIKIKNYPRKQIVAVLWEKLGDRVVNCVRPNTHLNMMTCVWIADS